MSRNIVNKRSLKEIGQFIFVQDGLEKADIIIVPGAPEPELAIAAARLWKSRYAPFILVTGKYSYRKASFAQEATELEEIDLPDTEAEYLARVLKREGVDESRIIMEKMSTNTFENARYSAAMLKGNDLEKIIICCQAFHARRALTYYQQQFPDVTFLVCPVVTRGISADSWFLSKEKTDVVLGELERCGEQFHCFLPVEDSPGKH